MPPLLALCRTRRRRGGGGHGPGPRRRFVAAVARVEVVAGVEPGPQAGRMRRIAQHGVEIRHRIELAAAADRKLALNAEKYPVDKSHGRATKYDKL